MTSHALLQIRGLVKRFPARRGLLGARRPAVKAVDGVDLDVPAGRTLALVGESGSGKTTAALCALRLLEPDAGSVHFDGRDITALPPRELRPLRKELQVVFQDPKASLNPRLCVRDLVGEALLVHGLATRTELDDRVVAVLGEVGLPADALQRLPGSFSGGQRQRVAIARALALDPRLVVLDEPTSALDVSIQAQIMELLLRLQLERGLAYLFISHDLGVVRHMASEVAVMRAGRVVERAATERLFQQPAHAYTRGLLGSLPIAGSSQRGR